MAYKNKEDQKAAARRHYEANKDKMKARAKEHSAKTREIVRALILEHLLANPCVDCPESDPIALEFDHREPSDKKFAIGEANSIGATPARVIAEIAKCDVRCANCHRKKTYKQRGFTHKDI